MTSINPYLSLLIIGLFLISGCSSEKEAERPNIIVFLADDMGWGGLLWE